MLTVEKLRRKPKHFHNFTGLTPQQFDQLLAAIEPLYEKGEVQRLSNPSRLRPRGAGRKFKLELPERLLMSLMYLRLYITQTLLGYLFGLDTSNVSREVQGRMLEVLSEVLPLPAREEPLDLALAASSSDRSSGRSGGGSKRKRRIGTLEELLVERGVEPVLYSGWEAIDVHERTAGEPHGRPRVKLCSWESLLEAAASK